MLKITYIYIDRQKDEYYRRAMDEYIKRISKYARFSEKILKSCALPESPSAAQIDAALEKEARSIESAIPKGAYKVAMCVEGKKMSSEQFAKLLDRTAASGFSEIAFIVGSSYGLSDSIKSACDLKLSVSDMTFPHGLFGVMLCEQIYRALSINAGDLYHK